MDDHSGKNRDIIIGAANGRHVKQLLKMSNRHGLIAGATGTGKTITLQILAEGFSQAGVPVFTSDIKGDLSGMGMAGKANPKITERLNLIKLPEFEFQPAAVEYWDVFGKKGQPIRATVSEMGPLLLASLLELNDTQTGILYACFKIADDDGLLLLDLKDLRAMLSWVSQHAKELRNDYGNISSSSIGAIQRKLLVLEQQGADKFFAEPALELEDLLKTDEDGFGKINILDATRLSAQSPRLYATFLLWLLSELFEELPEVGNADKPKLVFFFDEAHLLFKDTPKSLVNKIEQVVRLIRSKGVGIFFITQSPMDIPNAILGQLGMKIQHTLRAFTPKDRKAIKLVAETFRPNEHFSTAEMLTQLATGEALVSVLDNKGRPTAVEKTLICPPQSKMGPISAKMRKQYMLMSELAGKYQQTIDRESAYEILHARAEKKAELAEKNAQKLELEKQQQQEYKRANKKTSRSSSRRQTAGEAFMKSTLRSIGSSFGRRLVRGLLGSLLSGR
ncbi:MAG TPA: DUF853 family protein [Aeromonadales bacterium]|nr:DUF853 family protein [Aeromonadales bacterium]